MGFFDKYKGKSVGSLITSAFTDPTKYVTGTAGEPGLLGMGFSAPERYNVNAASFVDPNAGVDRQQLQDALAAQQNRQTALANDPFRPQQEQLANMLMLQAQGQGPSLAQNQLQQATDRNIQQQQGMMASNRGVGAGLAMRAGMQNVAGLGQQAAMDSANTRMQEQMNAQSQLGAALEAGRAGDVNTAALRDEMLRYYQGAILSQSEANRQAQIQKENLMSGNVANYNQAYQNAYSNTASARTGLLKSVGSMLASKAGGGAAGGA